MVSKEETYRAIVSGQRRGAVAALCRFGLSIIEQPYRWAVGYRNQQYDRKPAKSQRISVPVISVGNLTLGGTGKTPMVAWLAQWFRDRGVRVTLISRGYKDHSGSGNDEARELHERLPDVPHLQNPNRVAAARQAVEQLDTQLILLDDAFQHRRIQRDLDLVLIDATEPFGYGRVFPRGMLREPCKSLARASVIAITRCNLVDWQELEQIKLRVRQHAPKALCLEVEQHPSGLLASDGQTYDLGHLANEPLLAFCGIGNPTAFQSTLSGAGLKVDDVKVFPDHFGYPPDALDELAAWTRRHTQAVAIVCTHKDRVKLTADRLGRLPLFALLMEFRITHGKVEFESILESLVLRSLGDLDERAQR